MILRSMMLILLAMSASAKDKIINIGYEHWNMKYNCTKRGYESYYYVLNPIDGEDKLKSTYSSFYIERRIPVECRKLSQRSFRVSPSHHTKYDRSHGVTKRHWRYNSSAVYESYAMTNVHPMASRLNRNGPWRKIELLIDRWMKKGTIEVYGGVIWGNDSSNDHFLESHGIVTPDYFWKLVILPSGETKAWIIPNANLSSSVMLDNYLVAPIDIIVPFDLSILISHREKMERDIKSQAFPESFVTYIDNNGGRYAD